jgi:hypothetical protein
MSHISQEILQDFDLYEILNLWQKLNFVVKLLSLVSFVSFILQQIVQIFFCCLKNGIMKFKPNLISHCKIYVADPCFFFPDMVKIVTLQGRPKSNRKQLPQLNFDFKVESIGKSGSLPPSHKKQTQNSF